MNIQWYKSESTVKPDEICLDWSPRNVYLHRNIEQIEKTDEQGDTYKMWEYEEAKISRADYGIYAAEQADVKADENADAIIEVSEDTDTRITELEDAIIELANASAE